MDNPNPSCFKCGSKDSTSLIQLFGYNICPTCKSRLGLFRIETVERHHLSYKKAKTIDPKQPSYEEEVNYKLELLEKDYICKRIKLLDIQQQLAGLINSEK